MWIIIIRLLFYQFFFVFSIWTMDDDVSADTPEIQKIFSFTIPPFVLNSPPKNAFVSHVLSTLFTHTHTRAHALTRREKEEEDGKETRIRGVTAERTEKEEEEEEEVQQQQQQQ